MAQRPRVLKDGEDFPVKPDQIDATRHFFEAFDHLETEVSAGWIVRLCQKRGGWLPFTRDEIEAFYNAAGYYRFSFNRLFGEYTMQTGPYRRERKDSLGLVVQGADGKYRVTDDFILRCWRAASKPAAAAAT